MFRKPAVDRRSFLKGAAVTGAAALVPDAAANAAPAAVLQAAPAQGAGPTTPPVGVREVDPVVEIEAGPTGRPGSDFMLDVLKSLDPTAPASPSSETGANAPGKPEGSEPTKARPGSSTTEVSPTPDVTTSKPDVVTPESPSPRDATSPTTTTPVAPGN